jgi:hypothetical protein
MRFGKCSGLFAAAALALVWSVPAGAADIPIPGKIGIVKDTKLFKIVSKPVGAFTIPAVGSGTDPQIVGGDVNVFDSDGSGVLFDDLTGFPVGEGWKGLGNPPGTTGYKYKNTTAPGSGAVKIIILKPTVIKILAKTDGTLQPGPIGGNLGVELINGTDRRCADFGGTEIKNDPALYKHKDAPAPASCLTVAAPCCGTPSATHINFTNTNTAGDCGDILDAAGMVVTNVNCAGLYTGGGGNSVPLPYNIPDQNSSITKVTACAADVVTVGGATSTETGNNNRNCTAAGCLFGAPLTVPNPNSTPTSVCVLNEIATAVSGTVNCATGASTLNAPLASEIFLTGDKDAGAAGIQPCPRCVAGMCTTGANAGGTCTAGTSAINVGYPTSHDCPPDGSNSIGTLPIAFTLSTGTVLWSGTPATNDSGSTASVQTRVFSGFCRDVALPGGTGSFDADAMAGNQFKHCWENGMAVGTACSEADGPAGLGAESCEQRTQGAFGPNGGGNRTIRAIGNSMGITGGPAAATLVSVFTIPPTFDATIDGAGDLPGPGAVAIPGTAQTCTSGNPCP